MTAADFEAYSPSLETSIRLGTGDLGGTPVAPTVTGGTHHGHTAAQISDSTASGRALLTGAVHTQHQPSLGLYFVDAAGAVGDGTTDDSAAFASTATAVSNNGGVGTIVLTAGKTYLIHDWLLDGATFKSVTVAMHGATIRSSPSTTTNTIFVGPNAAVGTVAFEGGVFDDNSPNRTAVTQSMVVLARFARVAFTACRFINLVYHYVNTYNASAGGRIDLSCCSFDGDGLYSTASHIYADDTTVVWTDDRSTFTNSGAAATNNQAWYVYGCAGMTLVGSRFTNCAQSVDLRAAAANVLVSDVVIVGGVNGSTNGTGADLISTADDAVFENVTIINSSKAFAVRTTGGNRNTFNRISFRAGSNGTSTQRFARLAGAGHRIMNSDLNMALAGRTGAAGVFDVADQPTDCDIIACAVDCGAGEVFRVDAAQATVAARVVALGVRNQSATWIDTSNATGSTAVAMLTNYTSPVA